MAPRTSWHGKVCPISASFTAARDHDRGRRLVVWAQLIGGVANRTPEAHVGRGVALELRPETDDIETARRLRDRLTVWIDAQERKS